MRRYQLADIYARLRRAVTNGDVRQSVALLSEALPVVLPVPDASQLTDALANGLTSSLTCRGFKPAELAMLADDVKPVVKFEDIPLADGLRFQARFKDQYRILQSPPFSKDYLLLRTRPGTPSPQEALVTLYVSRGDQGERLREVEVRDPFAAVESGTLLGFPSCCTQAFAEVFGASRDDQDTVNDDATRQVVSQAPPTSPGNAWLNPLCDFEPIGFYACSPTCPNALDLARRSVNALSHRRPDLMPRMQAALTAPTLLWRLPFFLVFEGQADGEGVSYTRVHANAFPDPVVRRVQSVFAAAVLPTLRRGNWLAVRSDHLEVRKDGAVVAQLALTDTPPVLSTWVWQA